jgi:pSer/pThr/pTyr-binding forkhead associated (FHA) protein
MSQDPSPSFGALPHGTQTQTFSVGSGAGSGTHLVVVEGPTLGQVFPLRAAVCTIGRHQGCTVVLSSITVSRQHATITRQGNLFYVVDDRSSNGIYLNGQKLPPGQSCPLRHGDMLRLGEFLLLFKSEEKAVAVLALSTIDLDASRIRREVDQFLKDAPVANPDDDAPTTQG